MRHQARVLLLPFLVLWLTACTTDSLREAEQLGQPDAPLDRALYDGYLDLARFGAKAGASAASNRFSQKAQMAAKGLTPLPDTIDPAQLGKRQTSELLAASEQLREVLIRPDTPADPQNLARAQVAFDCWYQQILASEAAALAWDCRGDFYTAMGLLAEEPSVERPPPAVDLLVIHDDNLIGLVPFEFASAQVDYRGEQILAQIIEQARLDPNKIVLVEAYTDTVGDAASNQALAQDRAETVRTVLIDGGVDPDRIAVEAVGENHLMDFTSDDVRSQSNRVVVITLI